MFRERSHHDACRGSASLNVSRPTSKGRVRLGSEREEYGDCRAPLEDVDSPLSASLPMRLGVMRSRVECRAPVQLAPAAAPMITADRPEADAEQPIDA